jgi:penicillin-binding protein 1A
VHRTGGARWRRRALVIALVVVTAALQMLGLLLVLTPGTADAADRAAAQIAEHPGDTALTTVPTRLSAAVLATEDHRFYDHLGLDPIALGREGFAVIQGRDVGGATIEAQLAKLLYLNGRDDVSAKFEEAGLALKLNRNYSKDQILLMYLNVAYFGHGFYGAQAASVGYFQVAPSELDWNQAALLAGLLQAPGAYDPIAHPQEALARRHHVLDRLVATGALTQTEVAPLDQQGLELAITR